MNIVIYHSTDFDGIFCREIARKFLPKDTEFIGWNFGDPKVQIAADTERIYVLDLSPDCLSFEIPSQDPMERLIWIDHHKTSIDKWSEQIPGYRIDGVAACRLAWQYFKHWVPDLYDGRGGINTYWERSQKQEFIDRKVNEPLAVQLAGEYDVAGPNANEEALNFQFGLRSTEIAGDEEQLLTIGEFGDKLVREISERGVAVRGYLDRSDQLTVKSAFTLDFEGVRFLALNAYRGNSKAMQAAAAEKHDAILSFCWRGSGWTVSMYGIPSKPIDLSVIAKKYGGGGHPAACGFECKQLPLFLPPVLQQQ